MLICQHPFPLLRYLVIDGRLSFRSAARNLLFFRFPDPRLSAFIRGKVVPLSAMSRDDVDLQPYRCIPNMPTLACFRRLVFVFGLAILPVAICHLPFALNYPFTKLLNYQCLTHPVHPKI
jgi:hypothetical protein